MNANKKPKYKIILSEIKNHEKAELKEKIKKINNPNLNDFQKQLLLLSKEKSTTCLIKSYSDEGETIDIDKIKSVWEEKIQAKIREINNPNLSYLQKRYLVLEKEKTINYTLNGDNLSIINENNAKKTNCNECEGSSTDGDSSDKEAFTIEDDGLNVQKTKNKKKYKQRYPIDINKIKYNYEKMIIQKGEKYNHLNISDFQKRLLVLREEKTTTICITSTSTEKNENNDNSKTNIDIEKENSGKDDTMNKTKILLYNNDNSNISLDRTNDISNINDTNNTTISINEDYLNKSELYYKDYLSESTISDSIQKIEKFNNIRADFFLRHKLYDIPINIQEKDVITPKKYMINEKSFGFVYPNTLNTFYITESRYIVNHENNNDNTNINIDNNANFNKKLGLYFCGKNVDINTKNGIVNKQCAADNFICKKCMNINKNKYHIKNNYLININGRVAKINKGRYHCFGHFLCKKELEDCIVKFSCNACKELDLYAEYYS